MPGAIVVQQPPSPWHALLGGVGYGFSQGMDDYIQRKREKDALIAEILQQSDPGFLATDAGQAVLQKLGVQGDPAIQQMAQQGRQQFAPMAAGGPAEMPGGSIVNIPGVSPENMPDIPLPVYEQQKEAEEKARQEAEFYEELRRKVIEKKTLGAVEKALDPETTPQEKVGLLGESIKFLKMAGYEPESMSLNVGGVNVNLLTEYKKEQNRLKSAQKTADHFMEGREDYYSAVEDASTYKDQAVKYLAAIKAGNFDESVNFFAGIMSRLGDDKKETNFQNKAEAAKKFSPEQRIKYLAPFLNETLRIKNNKIKLYAKQAGITDPDILDPIDPNYLITLEEKLPETPPDKKESTDVSSEGTIKLPKKKSLLPSTESMMAEARFIFDTPKGRAQFKSVQEAFEWVKKGYLEEQKR